MQRLKNWAIAQPSALDIAFLVIFTVLVTLHPFYLFGKLNLFEAGLYLPGIDAIFKGEIPYRDFFHLRGPLELYFQALWMKVCGMNYDVLPTYFYVGAITTLVLFIMIAKELYQTRIFLYIMTLVFIARTFPRVSLTIGGGFRQVWGAAVVYLFIRYFKSRNPLFLWAGGFFSAVALMTSVEIGVYCFVSGFIAIALDAWFSRNRLFLKSIVIFILGSLLVILPLVVFLQLNGAFIPMLNAYYQVCANMTTTFPQIDPVPRNIIETMMAMVNPNHVNFKQLTPLFCYLGGFIYLINCYRKGVHYPGAIFLTLYGLMSFIGSMRGLWGPGFENAIQPEKVLMFFLLEHLWVRFKDHQQVQFRFFSIAFILVVFLSTLIYSVPRLEKRFSFVKILFSSNKKIASVFPFSERNLVVLDFPRMKGMVVPQEQAQDMVGLYRFFNTKGADAGKVVFFPDIGVYNFIVNRPFVGRFPIVTLSWIGKGWHEELMRSLDLERPPYIVTYQKPPDYLLTTQLVVPENNRKYEAVLSYISKHYHLLTTTTSYEIWHR